MTSKISIAFMATLVAFGTTSPVEKREFNGNWIDFCEVNVGQQLMVCKRPWYVFDGLGDAAAVLDSKFCSASEREVKCEYPLKSSISKRDWGVRNGVVDMKHKQTSTESQVDSTPLKRHWGVEFPGLQSPNDETTAASDSLLIERSGSGVNNGYAGVGNGKLAKDLLKRVKYEEHTTVLDTEDLLENESPQPKNQKRAFGGGEGGPWGPDDGPIPKLRVGEETDLFDDLRSIHLSIRPRITPFPVLSRRPTIIFGPRSRRCGPLEKCAFPDVPVETPTITTPLGGCGPLEKCTPPDATPTPDVLPSIVGGCGVLGNCDPPEPSIEII